MEKKVTVLAGEHICSVCERMKDRIAQIMFANGKMQRMCVACLKDIAKKVEDTTP